MARHVSQRLEALLQKLPSQQPPKGSTEGSQLDPVLRQHSSLKHTGNTPDSRQHAAPSRQPESPSAVHSALQSGSQAHPAWHPAPVSQVQVVQSGSQAHPAWHPASVSQGHPAQSGSQAHPASHAVL